MKQEAIPTGVLVLEPAQAKEEAMGTTKTFRLVPLQLTLIWLAALFLSVQTAFAQDTGLNLTFDKTAVSDTVWAGTVSGDITGTLVTSLISADTSDLIWQVEFYWIITAEDPSQSFVARLTGTLNSETGEVEMSGTVAEGYRQGAQVEEQGQLVDPETSRFEGTITIMAQTASE